METSKNYEILIEKIEGFIRRYYLNKLLRGALILTATLFFGFLFVVLSEYLGNFNSTIRGILFFGYWLVNGVLLCWLILPPLLSYLKLGKVISHDEAARIIGKHFNHVEDKLLNTLQLKRFADEHPTKRQLIEASIDQKMITLKPVTFPSAIKINQNIKYVKWVVLPLVIIIVLAIVAPAILKENTEKVIRHDEYFAPKSPFQFVVDNSELSIVQGEDFKLHILLKGNNFPDAIYVETAKNSFKMNKESSSRFSYTFNNLQQNVRFRLLGNDFRSQEYKITVNAKPSLLNFDATIQYPSYLKRKNESINNAGDLTLPVGTVVTWHIRTKNASQLVFTLDGKNELLRSDDNSFRKIGRAIHTGRYSLRAMSDQIDSGDSVAYQMNVIADQAPTITVNEKQDSVSTKAIYFTGQAQDDHGFSSLLFHYTVKEKDNPKAKIVELPIKADLSNSQTTFFHFWNLNELHLKPESQVTYYFQVTDNNGATGYQTTRTEERTLRLPSETEIYKQLNANAESVKDKIQNAIDMAAQIDKDIKKLNELLLNKANLSFDDKKRIQDLLNKRQELKKLIEEAQKQNQQNALNRQENMQMNKDEVEKQNRMDKLMNDLLDSKMDERLKMLQNMMDNKLENPASKELAKMQLDDKALGQQLNRTLELMKRLDVNTKVQESISRLNKLTERQQELAQETKQNDSDTKSLLQKQEGISKDFEELKKSLEEVTKKNEQLEEKTNFENPKSDLQKIDDQLNNSAKNLQQNKKNDANAKQQEVTNSMQKLAKKMQQKLQEEELADIIINGKNLRNLIKRLIETSFEQEKILTTLKITKSHDPSYPKWTQRQKYVQTNMRTTQDSLISLSKRLPEIESTVISETASLNQNIDEAVKYLGERRSGDAEKNQRQAMTSMNNLALMLSETLTKMQASMKQSPKGESSPGGGSKQRKTLLQLSEMQQKLNANMQAMRDKMKQEGAQQQQPGKIGNQASGEGQGSAVSEQFARMARQQAEIRQAIEQINREENKDGHHQLGDLGTLAKQMEKTEADLVNKRLTDDMISRQLQIRTRLLEANKADQERDQDSKRESKVPKNDVPPGLNKALQAYEREKSKQTELLKTTPATLNDYYKSKVKQYFDQVNK